MNLTLIDQAELSDIPEVSDLDVSFEGLALPKSNLDRLMNEGDETTDNSQQATSPANVGYTITPLKSGTGRLICFYLNVLNLTAQAINQFVMMMEVLPTKDDVLLIHFNSVLYCDEAETIYNAIKGADVKKKIASIPYSLNTAAFFPALACDVIIPFDLSYHTFDVPSIRAGGNLRDSKNVFEYDVSRKMRLLNMVREAGFIPDNAYVHITEHQGCFTLYGELRDSAVEAFNQRNKS